MLGDFNFVLHSKDRIGENPVTMVEVFEYQYCLNINGLEELVNLCCKYTLNDKEKLVEFFQKLTGHL